MCVTHMHVCDMTLPWVCGMNVSDTHSCVWHDPLIGVWHDPPMGVSHECVRHDPLMGVWDEFYLKIVERTLWSGRVPTTKADDTGWRRPIGCLKLQVIFRKRATNYRALLRKMTYEDKASYDSAPPCTHMLSCRSFSAKEPIISGSFAKNDLQIKVSYGFVSQYVCVYIVTSKCEVNRRRSSIGLRV